MYKVGKGTQTHIHRMNKCTSRSGKNGRLLVVAWGWYVFFFSLFRFRSHRHSFFHFDGPSNFLRKLYAPKDRNGMHTERCASQYRSGTSPKDPTLVLIFQPTVMASMGKTLDAELDSFISVLPVWFYLWWVFNYRELHSPPPQLCTRAHRLPRDLRIISWDIFVEKHSHASFTVILYLCCEEVSRALWVCVKVTICVRIHKGPGRKI